ncbi:unnamed protein product [Amoebophrya sp. A25]|nr:unnamed protein product [Amoebophrya sp. A25]|eukprot:GSA25T00024823001.1
MVNVAREQARSSLECAIALKTVIKSDCFLVPGGGVVRKVEASMSDGPEVMAVGVGVASKRLEPFAGHADGGTRGREAIRDENVINGGTSSRWTSFAQNDAEIRRGEAAIAACSSSIATANRKPEVVNQIRRTTPSTTTKTVCVDEPQVLLSRKEFLAVEALAWKAVYELGGGGGTSRILQRRVLLRRAKRLDPSLRPERISPYALVYTFHAISHFQNYLLVPQDKLTFLAEESGSVVEDKAEPEGRNIAKANDTISASASNCMEGEDGKTGGGVPSSKVVVRSTDDERREIQGTPASISSKHIYFGREGRGGVSSSSSPQQSIVLRGGPMLLQVCKKAQHEVCRKDFVGQNFKLALELANHLSDLITGPLADGSPATSSGTRTTSEDSRTSYIPRGKTNRRSPSKTPVGVACRDLLRSVFDKIQEYMALCRRSHLRGLDDVKPSDVFFAVNAYGRTQALFQQPSLEQPWQRGSGSRGAPNTSSTSFRATGEVGRESRGVTTTSTTSMETSATKPASTSESESETSDSSCGSTTAEAEEKEKGVLDEDQGTTLLSSSNDVNEKKVREADVGADQAGHEEQKNLHEMKASSSDTVNSSSGSAGPTTTPPLIFAGERRAFVEGLIFSSSLHAEPASWNSQCVCADLEIPGYRKSASAL